LRNAIEKNVIHKFSENEMRVGLYRPFTKQFLYYDRPFIESPGLWSQFFPIADIENIVICLNGPGGGKGFGCLITDTIPDYHSVGDTHCFPLYWYEKKPVNGKWVEQSLFVDDHSRFTTSHLPSTNNEYIRRDGVSDFILDQAQTRYGPRVVKEDIFYYVYGILHSPDYRKTFASDLKKTLPRLPLVEKTADFWAFSDAGRKLAALHLNYEDQPPLEGVLVNGEEASSKSPHTTYNLPPTTYNLPLTTYNLPPTTSNLPPTTSNLPPTTYQITKMTFPAKGQKDTIKYNADITITNIPAKAYEYVVNGKSAIEWIMERYAVTTHKESGITNDPNDWAIEHNNPRYILDLLLSVISVSVETVDIVAGLPEAEWK
jgi:predicted helicase